MQAAVISLSGVMAPGPVTAITLAAGARSRHAGALVAVGHGIVEFPLMILIMVGVGTVLTTQAFRIAVGIAGGAALLLMAVMMLIGLRRQPNQPRHVNLANPVWAGVVLSGGNPYFLLWWATVGLALATKAINLGTLAFGLFAVIHWLCDLAWLEMLSLASNKGATLLGPHGRRVVIIICALAMGVFGILFVCDALNYHLSAQGSAAPYPRSSPG
ncbi:MAG: LysE family transporter [Planctomycetes bacterium]|nr:LysE family transporter [Planctomycetota bacterium]